MLKPLKEIINSTITGDNHRFLCFNEHLPNSRLAAAGAGGLYYWHEDERYELTRVKPKWLNHNMIYLLKGELLIETETADIKLEEGEVVTFPSSTKRRITMTSSKASVLHIRFDDGDNVVSFSNLSTFHSAECKSIHRILENLSHEQLSVLENREQVTQLYMELLSVSITRDIRLLSNGSSRDIRLLSNGSSRDMRARLECLWAAVRADPGRDWHVSELARHASVSTSYLYQLCQQFYGVSSSELLKRIRMEHAKMLLCVTEHGLDHIASEVGYGSAYAFSNVFNRFVGMRPGAYRNAVTW